jgi:hypothetical protein
MTTPDWRRSETLAWTRRDGVTPPPDGVNRWFFGAIALSMAGVWIGMIATDALCPEHRMWVQTFGVLASLSAVSSIFGLAGQRFWAPLAALASALLGIAVGFIDAVHSPTRGALISIAFAIVSVAVLVASVPQLRSALWIRRASAELNVEPVELPTVGVATSGARSAVPAGPAPERDQMPAGADGAFAPTSARRRARPRG